MNYDEMLAQTTREGQQRKIDDIFYTTLENILSIYGGEENIEPGALANIKGALTRAKTLALIPSETSNGPKETSRVCSFL